ncbi:MAG: hypothetical protein RIS25_30 [Actinomycetota bacterium]|jgi:MinD-like ATPase involved in chromosome partitioning or flagellar assembly
MFVCGIVGDQSLADWVAPLEDWCTVGWGTDDPIDAVRRFQQGSDVTVVLVSASVTFLTPLLITVARENQVRVVAIAVTDDEALWVDVLDGIDRVSSPESARRLFVDGVSEREVVPSEQVNPFTSWFESAAAGEQRAPEDEPDVVPEEEKAELQPRMIAVWGPLGSPGRTSMAIALAHHASTSGRSTLLIDADTYGSSVAIGLGLLDETPGFAACCRLAGKGQLTESEVLRLREVVRHDPGGFDVLTGIPRTSRWGETERSKAREVFELTRRMYDVVIVDVGFCIEDNEWIDAVAPSRNGTTQLALQQADAVIAVGLPDPVGLARLIRGLDEISELCDEPIVVINRASPREFEESRRILERFTSTSPAHSIPPDSRGGLHDTIARVRAVTEYRAVACRAGIVSPSPAAKKGLFGR